MSLLVKNQTYSRSLYQFYFCISLGITNTIGRILSGLLVDIFKLNALVINNCALVLSAVLLFVEPFCTSYELLIGFAVFYGLCVGKSLIRQRINTK